MVNRFWSGLITLLLLSGCGWDGTATRPNDFTKLTSITISAVSSKIASGTSTKLIATGHFSGQFSRDVTDQAAWSSASPGVADFKYATAPNLNRVTAVAPGSAVVSATVDGVSATFTLTVSNASATAVTITPNTASLPKGLKNQFTASGAFSDATTQDLTFDAVWSATPGTFATVSNDPASKGLATAIAIGSELITAAFGPLPVVGTASLTVTAATLQTISITPANSSIAGLSKTVNFAAKGNYSDGTTVDITTATWSSSATNIATVIASSGVATSVAVGTTVISATLNGIIGRTNLTVTAPTLNSNGLQITPSNPFVPVNMTQQLTVTATFNDGSTQNVTSNCSWSSSASSIVSVSPTGVATTGNLVGSSVITATYSGQSAFTTVTVQ
jgi:hypothetical protein